MIDRVLVVAAHCPNPAASNDGQANYLIEATRALRRETGARIDVAALRLGDQVPAEEFDGLSVRRFEPPRPIRKLYQLYEPPIFAEAASALAKGACHAASALGSRVPVLAHGYETGYAMRRLRGVGHAVVGVLHYSVGQEILHALEFSERLTESRTLWNRASDVVRLVSRPSIRSSLIRHCSRHASSMGHLFPTRVRPALEKLEQEAAFLRSAHSVVAVSAGFARSIAALYRGAVNDVRASTAGAPPRLPSSPRWPFAPRPDRLRLVMVGRPARQKGWHYLAEALRAVERSQPGRARQLEFAAIGGIGAWGGAYSASVFNSLSTLKHVAFSNLGELRHEEVMRVLAAADVLVLPSIFEPFGLVALEAAAAGCLVVAADADGPTDVVRPPWGILVPFGKPRERVNALVQGICSSLALSRQELVERGAAARAAAAAYSWTDCARVHAQALADAWVTAS